MSENTSKVGYLARITQALLLIGIVVVLFIGIMVFTQVLIAGSFLALIMSGVCMFLVKYMYEIWLARYCKLYNVDPNIFKPTYGPPSSTNKSSSNLGNGYFYYGKSSDNSDNYELGSTYRDNYLDKDDYDYDDSYDD